MRKSGPAPIGRYLTPRKASGISATMINALKITAESTALCGVARLHDVERVELRIGHREGRRDDGEVLGDIVGDTKGRQRPARDQQLLADFHHLNQLGRVGVEIDHVGRFLGGLRAGVHRHPHICLGQGRGIVGAIAGHGHHAPAGLLLADELHLVLRRGLRQEVIDAGFLGDGGGGERVIPGDHDGADAHAPQLVEARAHAALDDVLELDYAQHARLLHGAIGVSLCFGHHQRRTAHAGDAIDNHFQFVAAYSPMLRHIGGN